MSDTETRATGIALSIIIGVGGTGYEIELEARRYLMDKYEDLNRIGTVKFLHIDTDPAEPNPAEYERELWLDPADRIKAVVADMKLYKSNMDAFPHLREWMPSKSKYERALDKPISAGASQVRSRGRFAYMVNFNLILDKIRDAYRTVTSGTVIEQTQRNGIPVDVNALNIYVVGSMLGGTGSGMFTDLAYTIREYMIGGAANRRPHTLIGVFVMPPPGGGGIGSRMMANAYSSLIELNHWNHPNTRFTARYTDQPQPPPINTPDQMFDYCYLLDTANEKGINVSKRKLAQMIGRYVFLDLTSDFASFKNSIRDNFKAKLGGDSWGAPTCYLSFGLSSLTFPHDQLVRVAANRMAKEAIDSVIQPRTVKDDDHLEGEIETELKTARLDKDNVFITLRGLTGTDSSDAVEHMRQAWIDLMNEAQSLPNVAAANRLEEIYRRFDSQCFNKNKRENDVLAIPEQDLGAYLLAIQRRLYGQIEKLTLEPGILTHTESMRWLDNQIVEDKINHADYRQHNTKKFLVGLNRRVEKYSDSLNAELTKLNTEIPQLWKQLTEAQKALADLARTKDPGVVDFRSKQNKKEVIARYCGAASDYQWKQLLEFMYRCAIRFYEKFGDAIQRAYGDIAAYDGRIKEIYRDYQMHQEEWEARAPVINGRLIYDEYGSQNVQQAMPRYYDRLLIRAGGIASVWETVNADKELDMLDIKMYRTIMSGPRSEMLAKKLYAECYRRCKEFFNQISVLEMFQKVNDAPTQATFIRDLNDLSSPFFNTHAAGATTGYHEDATQQRSSLVGFSNANQPMARSEAETNFAELYQNVQGPMTTMVSMNNKTEVLFLWEMGGFPLRVLGNGLQSYEASYRAEQNNTESDAVHSRGDIAPGAWTRILPPSPEILERAWTNFLVLRAAGKIVLKSERRLTDRGPKIVNTYVWPFKDYQNKDQELILATGVPPENELKIGAGTEKCPREFNDMLILMSDLLNSNRLSETGERMDNMVIAIHTEMDEAFALDADKGDLTGVLIPYLNSFDKESDWYKNVNVMFTDFINREFGGVISLPRTSVAPPAVASIPSVPRVAPSVVTDSRIDLEVQAAKIQEQLRKIGAMLADPAEADLHAHARTRETKLKDELFDIRMQLKALPATTTPDLDAEFERRLNQLK